MRTNPDRGTSIITPVPTSAAEPSRDQAVRDRLANLVIQLELRRRTRRIPGNR